MGSDAAWEVVGVEWFRMSRGKRDGRGKRTNGEVPRIGCAKVVGRRVVAAAGCDATGDPAHKRDSKRVVARAMRRAGTSEARDGLADEAVSPGRPREGSHLVAHRFVKVMADYGAEGVWDRDGRLADAGDLPVDDDLRRRLVGWSARFRLHDPGAPDSASPAEVRAHETDGLTIARAVKAALPDWTVVYRSVELEGASDAH